MTNTIITAPRRAGKQTALNRELLELAAKAAGYKPDGSFGAGLLVVVDAGLPTQKAFSFNPRDDDGDSRRLQVACRISLRIYDNAPPELGLPRSCAVAVTLSGEWFAEAFRPDENAAARLAVLQAAAAIGRAMP